MDKVIREQYKEFSIRIQTTESGRSYLRVVSDTKIEFDEPFDYRMTMADALIWFATKIKLDGDNT